MSEDQEPGPNDAAAANLSDYLRKLGRKGGKARLKTMTKAERSAIARKAAAASAKVRTKKANKRKATSTRKRSPTKSTTSVTK